MSMGGGGLEGRIEGRMCEVGLRSIGEKEDEAQMSKKASSAAMAMLICRRCFRTSLELQIEAIHTGLAAVVFLCRMILSAIVTLFFIFKSTEVLFGISALSAIVMLFFMFGRSRHQYSRSAHRLFVQT